VCTSRRDSLIGTASADFAVGSGSRSVPTVANLLNSIGLVKAFQPTPKADMERLAQAHSTRNKTASIEFFRNTGMPDAGVLTKLGLADTVEVHS